MSKGRSFCFTVNNYTEEQVEFLKSIECKYICFGFEIAPKTGTPHLQGYVSFNNPRSFKSVSKLLPWHISIAKGSGAQNKAYCTKEGEFYERGDIPKDPKDQGTVEKERWDNARSAAVEGRMDDIVDSDIYIRCYGSLKRIRDDHAIKAKNLEGDSSLRTGLWIWGPAGCGKTRKAHDEYDNLYIKDWTKWWDHYQGEENVLIDDMSPRHAEIFGDILKIWTDRYAFKAQNKGGYMHIRPKLIIITSQYPMERVFLEKETYDAMKRRFNIIDMN